MKNHKNKLIIALIAIICIASTVLICYYVFPYFFSYNNANDFQVSTQDSDITENFSVKNLVNAPVKFTNTSTSYPNSVGGVDLTFHWENIGTKSIKYIYIYAIPYNRVGDIEPSDIGGKTTAKCRMIGPYESGDSGNATFENVWYNSAISSAKIDKVEIEYMDGTSEAFERMGI